ncbi:hypothetical protein [Galactobacter valiniphilus]|uniref:hypothetical protein n=1 Tax=Galactobacter valiniphilus TaxID=2676122 RepID=UPI003735CD4F
MSETPTPVTADTVYKAELEGPEHENAIAKAGRFVAELATRAFGDDSSGLSGVAVVVRRLDDGAEVRRIDAGNYESDETVLAMVREDLASLSPEDFLETWGEGTEA